MSCSFRLGSSFLAGLLALLVFFSAAPARGETENCTAINALPFTIAASGIYCLKADLQTNLAVGQALTIAADNVTLDLNAHTIENLAGSQTTAYGVYASNRFNLTVKNGSVRGFLYGIMLQDTTSGWRTAHSNVVEDVRANNNYYCGIYMGGRAVMVRNNQVGNIGGTTAYGQNVTAYGIFVVGTGPRVLDNDVSDVYPQGSWQAYGIVVAHTMTDAFIAGNRVSAVNNGIAFFAGSTGKYAGNLTSGVATPFTGGTNAGGNN